MIKYEIVDFKGEVCWIKIDDNNYEVDPQFVEMFKAEVLK